MLRPNDITDLALLETTVATSPTTSAPGVIVSFKLRGNGPYRVALAKQDITAEKIMKEVRAYATELTKVLDGEV